MSVLTIEYIKRDVPSLKQDVYLSASEAGALVGITGTHSKLVELCQVGSGAGISKNAVRDAILRKLSAREYVTGNIVRGKILWDITPLGSKIAVAIDELVETINQEIESKKQSFDKSDFEEKLRNNYYAIDNNTAGEFKSDLFADFGVTNNSKADKAFQLAWEYGHSAGYYEVINYFHDLVGLIE
jgi:hypothetical protein